MGKKRKGGKLGSFAVCERSCMTCMNCIPIGEGDHICDEAEDSDDVLVLEDYTPAEAYMWCKGKRYTER